ncbi:hypothetical protein [Salinimicrobium soli]|uniref:hypothetical protein n=1 Tax=Salinimicrobium soli TaxID=1254399 RepID=UPI003AAEC547
MKILKFLAGGLFCLLLLACGSSHTSFKESDVLRQAQDVPTQFEAPTGMSFNDDSCLSPLMDPRTGNKISIVRSTKSLGDYEVPQGLYGVNRGELLRVNCSTGEVVGIVKK